MSKWMQWVASTLLFWFVGFLTSYKQISITSKRGLMFWIFFGGLSMILAAIIVNLPFNIVTYIIGLVLGYIVYRILLAGEKYMKSDKD